LPESFYFKGTGIIKFYEKPLGATGIVPWGRREWKWIYPSRETILP
jgi:hypothetical protein